MKLAALTSDEKEVEEFSKTLKMARPSADEINQAAAPVKPKSKPGPRPVAQRQSAAPPRPSAGKVTNAKASMLGNWVLVILAILVLFGLFELIEVVFF